MWRSRTVPRRPQSHRGRRAPLSQSRKLLCRYRWVTTVGAGQTLSGALTVDGSADTLAQRRPCFKDGGNHLERRDPVLPRNQRTRDWRGLHSIYRVLSKSAYAFFGQHRSAERYSLYRVLAYAASFGSDRRKIMARRRITATLG